MTENPNMQNQSEEDSQTARWGSGYTVGLNLVVSVILGGAIGLGLDHLLGTKPILMLIMIVVGFVAGMREIWIMLSEAQKKDSEKS